MDRLLFSTEMIPAPKSYDRLEDYSTEIFAETDTVKTEGLTLLGD
jgi:hypothetical protein